MSSPKFSRSVRVLDPTSESDSVVHMVADVDTAISPALDEECQIIELVDVIPAEFPLNSSSTVDAENEIISLVHVLDEPAVGEAQGESAEQDRQAAIEHDSQPPPEVDVEQVQSPITDPEVLSVEERMALMQGEQTESVVEEIKAETSDAQAMVDSVSAFIEESGLSSGGEDGENLEAEVKTDTQTGIETEEEEPCRPLTVVCNGSDMHIRLPVVLSTKQCLSLCNELYCMCSSDTESSDCHIHLPTDPCPSIALIGALYELQRDCQERGAAFHLVLVGGPLPTDLMQVVGAKFIHVDLAAEWSGVFQ